MPTTSITAPVTHTLIAAAGLGYSYVFAEERLLEAMTDTLDMVGMGLVGLKGDVAGSGSDTLRIEEVDDLGFARRMTALSGEADTITASPFTLGYSDLTVGVYGLAHEETYHHQVIDRPRGYNLDELMGMVPASWLATVRYLACVAGAGITGVSGAAATTLSVDDYIDYLTAHREQLGAAARGAPPLALKPQQVSQLFESARSEPALQMSAESFAKIQGAVGQVIQNWAGLGLDIFTTDDVQTSGGAYQGFGVSPGGMGWGRASTGRIRPSGNGAAHYMPQFGLFLEEIGKGGNGMARYEARAWLGIALGSANVFFQRRLISQV